MKIEAPLGPVDDWPQWTPAMTCNPVAKPGVVAFADWVRTSLGGTTQIVRPCDMGNKLSLHHEGRALDWFPPDPDVAEAFVACMTQEVEGESAMLARRAGIPVIIWNRQIWSAGHRKWRPYTGASPHTDHVHFGFSWPGAEGKTSLYDVLATSSGGTLDVAAEMALEELTGGEPVVLASVSGLAQRSDRYRRKLVKVAKSIGADPSSLAAVITIESGHNPQAVNPHTGASGLIQIMPANVAQFGVTLGQLRKMSATKQLDLVEQWFRKAGATNITRPADHYLAVFNPAHVGKPSDFVLYAEGEKGYAQNKVLDFDKDGTIRVDDVARLVEKVLDDASSRPPFVVDTSANPLVVGLATIVVAAGVAAAVKVTT